MSWHMTCRDINIHDIWHKNFYIVASLIASYFNVQLAIPSCFIQVYDGSGGGGNGGGGGGGDDDAATGLKAIGFGIILCVAAIVSLL